MRSFSVGVKKMNSVVLEATSEYLGELSRFRYLLEYLGFKVNILERISLDELTKGKVLIIAAKRYEKYTIDEVSLILRAIREGVGALILLDPESSPDFDSLQSILSEAGIFISGHIVKERSDENLVRLTNINKNHRITIGIREIITGPPKVLMIAGSVGQKLSVLVRSGKEHDPPEAIVSCAGQLGNGKIVVFSSWSIASNNLIDRGHNALFLVSSTYWLANLMPKEGILDKIDEALGWKPEM